jgi:hypothetical protein
VTAVFRRASLAPLAVFAAALLLVPVASAQRQRTTDLRLSTTTGVPSSLAAGRTFTLRTTVANRGRRTAKRVRIIVGLTRGTRARVTASRLGSRRLKSAFRRGRRVRLSVPVRVGSARSGSYRVVVCITQAGRRARCTLSRRLTVRPPAAGGGASSPGPPATTPGPPPPPP